MPNKTATVIGSTGLIGSHLVDQLQQDPSFSEIRALVRRPIRFPQSKVEVMLVDFSDPESFKLAIDGSHAVFCAIGTTQKKVGGNRDAYRKVDYDIPVNAARFCAETGTGHFLLVSSVGASTASNNFYLKLKGEVEGAVMQQPIPCISIFRPSILLGDRKENRPGERAGQVVMQAFSFLFFGKNRKYRPIQAGEVAAAMIKACRLHTDGIYLYEYNRMKE